MITNNMVRITLLMVLLIGVVPAATAEEDLLQETFDIFTLDFVLYNDGGGDWHEVDIEDGTTTNFAPYASDAWPSTHEMVITSRDGETLWETELKIDFEMHPFGGEHYEVDEREFYWRLPYFWEAKNISIYEYERLDDGHDDHSHGHTHGDIEVDTDSTELVFTVDLEDEFCQLDGRCRAFCDGKQVDADCSCGDGVCHPHESAEICPEDCDPDHITERETITEIDDVPEDETNIRTFLILAVIVALLGMLLMYAWKRVEIEETPEESR